jgi:uncharacterized Zn finger protein
MFLLFGSAPVATVLFVVMFTCGHCGHQADQRVVREQQKVTLFFIPLFSLRTSWFVQCEHCGIATELSREQAEHSMQWAESHRSALSEAR